MKLFLDWLFWVNRTEKIKILIFSQEFIEVICTENCEIENYSNTTLNKYNHFDVIYIPFFKKDMSKEEILPKFIFSLLKKNGLIVLPVNRYKSSVLNKIYRRIFYNKNYNNEFSGLPRQKLPFLLTTYNLKIQKELFVFPSIIKPWTISDNPNFIRNFKNTKKRTLKNRLIYNLLTSNLGVQLVKKYWNDKILFLNG